jgi:hypothetical protein
MPASERSAIFVESPNILLVVLGQVGADSTRMRAAFGSVSGVRPRAHE